MSQTLSYTKLPLVPKTLTTDTNEERKAWSLNMGHESEQTTDQYYGQMSDDKRFEVLDNIGNKKTFDPQNMTESDKAKAFDALISAFNKTR